MTRPEIVIAGHSHAMAMGLPVVARDAAELVSIGPDRWGLVGGWPRAADYWDALEREARQRAVILSWQGTEYLARFLVAPDPLFDFVPRARPDSPLVAGATLVPESAVRTLFARTFADAAGVVARVVRSAAAVFLPAPPPPKDDDDLIRRRVLMEQGFRVRLEKLGVSPDTVVFSPPLLRLKLWELTQDLLAEAVEGVGGVYVPCPTEARDAHGLLRREFWNEDITHANRAFGKLMLDRMEKML